MDRHVVRSVAFTILIGIDSEVLGLLVFDNEMILVLGCLLQQEEEAAKARRFLLATCSTVDFVNVLLIFIIVVTTLSSVTR